MPPTIADPDGRIDRPPRRVRKLQWRLILDSTRPGATNMALDHALAASLGDDEGVVRLYGWARPTVSFGKNEPAAPIDGLAVDYVRRPTGGRAVLHDQELTYAVVAPLDAFGGLREAYVGINEILADAMGSLGATVEVVGRGARSLGPDAGPCFQAPATGELVSRGRKLVGSAQARLEGVLLQHGSILLAGDQGPLGVGDGTVPPVTLAELLGHVDLGDVTRATAESFRSSLRGAWKEEGFRPTELVEAERLEAERYGMETWTWRR